MNRLPRRSVVSEEDYLEKFKGKVLIYTDSHKLYPPIVDFRELSRYYIE